ncbi:MAG: hypothetical protein HYR49_04385 [Gammaproteobacteria bacterium]|nr:hypothetical protein [Gammaproteobacteria bacterium]
MNTKPPVAAIAVLMLAACTANTRPDPQQGGEAELSQAAEGYNAGVDDPNQEVVCRMEAVVGTRIKKEVCRTRTAMDVESKEAKRFLNKPRPVPTQD